MLLFNEKIKPLLPYLDPSFLFHSSSVNPPNMLFSSVITNVTVKALPSHLLWKYSVSYPSLEDKYNKLHFFIKIIHYSFVH